MNRTQFQTNAAQAKDGKFMTYEDYASSAKFKQEADSDSGEDFDYGEEEGDNPGDSNIDLMEYISNIDVSNIQGRQTVKQPSSGSFPQETSSSSTSERRKTETQNKSPSKVCDDLMDLFNLPPQN